MSMDAAAKKMPSGANAPYKIVPAGKKFVVKNNAGETKATFDSRPAAVDYLNALYANVKGAAKRAAKVPFTGKAKNRAPKTATAAEDIAMDLACGDLIMCHDPECSRTFLDFVRMADHADAVHTFSDIEELVRDAVREKYNRDGDRTAVPPVSYRYAWVRDLSTDWVVFELSESGSNRERQTLFKSSYSLVDGVVTLGEPVEVVRKTVYEPVAQSTTGA